MNHAVRDELLQVLSRFSEHAPDLRFGQLIANLAFLARSTGHSDVWEVEDGEMLEAARSFLHDLESRTKALGRGTSV